MISSALRSLWSIKTPFENLGKELHKTRNVVKGSYDFAVQGGAVGNIDLLDEDGNAIWIPSKAIICHGYIDILTAMVSTGNDGTMALTLQSAGDLKAAVDGDTLSGVVALVPVNTAATAIKLTADRKLIMAVAVHAFTAGKFDVFVEYLLGQ